MFNPFDMNPLDFDPLRDVLSDHIDFEKLRTQSHIGLYIAATEANSGKAHIFQTEEITIETVLASACLPFVSKAIMIEGQQYWDGAYSANPAIRPVISHSNTDDTLLVQLSPMELFAVPDHMQPFGGSRSQLSFSQSLRRELELIEEGREISTSGIALSARARRIARHRFHLIDGSSITAKLNPGSEMTPDWNMLSDLFLEGRKGAETFLMDHRNDIGHKASVSLKEHFDL
jgi:NTE family protein